MGRLQDIACVPAPGVYCFNIKDTAQPHALDLLRVTQKVPEGSSSASGVSLPPKSSFLLPCSSNRGSKSLFTSFLRRSGILSLSRGGHGSPEPVRANTRLQGRLKISGGCGAGDLRADPQTVSVSPASCPPPPHPPEQSSLEQRSLPPRAAMEGGTCAGTCACQPLCWDGGRACPSVPKGSRPLPPPSLPGLIKYGPARGSGKKPFCAGPGSQVSGSPNAMPEPHDPSQG